MLLEKTKEASNAKSYDFEKRLAEIKAKEAAVRTEKRRQKQAEKDKVRAELAKDSAVPQPGDDDMMKMMGFSGFGSSKK
jgi:U4/U6.U5 tri-snRNP component SNU23